MENVNWFTLVMSSAVVSALVNVCWSAWQKHLDRKREDEKEAKRVGHAYLDLALQLESFARRCNAYLYDIHDGLMRRSESHDDSTLHKLRSISFVYDPEPNWIELPISFAAEVKNLPAQFNAANDWIKEQFDLWADTADAYQLEEERVAYYGNKAYEIAANIRQQISAGDGDMGSIADHFRSLIRERQKRFQANPDGLTLTPDLHTQFVREQRVID